MGKLTMAQSMKEQVMTYLLKEIRKTKMSLYNAIKRQAPEQDIKNLRRKLEIFEWLRVTIKEED